MSRKDRRKTLMEAQNDEGADLSFGGWRDWLLLVVAAPIFVGTVYAAAMLGIGSRGRGVLLSPLGGAIVTLVAVVAGLLIGRSDRGRRWLDRS